MIPLDHGDRAAFPEQRAEAFERTARVCKMLKGEADEDVIKTSRFVGEVKDIAGLEDDVRDAFGPHMLPSLTNWRLRDIDRRDPGLVLGLFRARITIRVPVPQPASSTREPAGYRVSSWRSPVRISA